MEPVLEDSVRCVQQALDLIGQLPSELYATKDDQALGASIGGHIRHNIDHYLSFLRQAEGGRIDYDDRQRESAAETDPGVAYQRLHAIGSAIAHLDAADLEKPVDVKVNCGRSSEWSASTVRRELQFLLSHSVHHYAIIAMMCERHEIPVPDGFGVAPSTLKYRQSIADNGS